MLAWEDTKPKRLPNKVVWSRCPKKVWVGVNTLQQAPYAAVAHFNDGNKSFINILEQLGIDAGHFCHTACQKMDNLRIDKSKRSSTVSKKRKTPRAIKKGFQDKHTAQEGTSYEKGAF